MDSFKIAEFNIDNLFEEIEKDLFSEEFTLKNLGNNNVTARHLQYWSDNDLLPESKRKQDENHKFNFVELIWIKIIYELRVLGFNINKIKSNARISTLLYTTPLVLDRPTSSAPPLV